MFDLKELLQTTSEFMDRNASKILKSEDFLVLSSDALVKLISRNSFCSDEMNIFKGLVNFMPTRNAIRVAVILFFGSMAVFDDPA